MYLGLREEENICVIIVAFGDDDHTNVYALFMRG